MHIGQIISGGGHVALIGWLLVGDIFTAEPLPTQTTEVSVISGEAFAAMMVARAEPDATTQVATPVPPDAASDPVALPQTDGSVDQASPRAVQIPAPEAVPEVPEPLPVPQVTPDDTPPVLEPPREDVAVLAPQTSNRPVPRPSERVAPEPVAQPDPDVRPDQIERAAVEQAETGETVQEPQEATAPEEAAPEIVTEAEQPSGNLTTSLRPPSRRPKPPVRQAVEAEPDPQPQADTQDAVAEALAEALAGAAPQTAPIAPSGPPLSAGEKDALRVAVSSCWNVGSLSSAALETTVTVAVSLSREGKPIGATLRMIGSEGGTQASANQAYEAARRAIIRCGARGFDLPAEKYDHWKDIEMTFNPERMRIK